ncbi:hypothetical protein AM493_14900 [Flavobacterium akiainvivens]|uniref:Uncharacterized protein n=1 Tax=Flavobacterium akiainvivens TaxID=1202724 RepID=A0A0M9VIZ3_9FLAO|nr:hypothetical protein [Flavobacterium akiainvivens]KOS07186.1 hypothetical protein AM493_14900 [Flavobacterium akiainvivens]SFQ72846.1 hypothetical protein SAMN05444144_11831 [Flavobacterium akiainvivens]
MASAFWTLEDGRCYSRKWSWMAHMLLLITDELQHIRGAKAFYEYLEPFVFRDEEGDEINGYGGFIRGEESIMFNFDLRSFAPQNRDFFWMAAQRALKRLIIAKDADNEGSIFILTILLDMHKRILKKEDPMLLNHLTVIEPEPEEKLGPGWG